MNTPDLGAEAHIDVPRLETQRLLIRPLMQDDLEDCHRLYLDIGWADSDRTEESNRERRRTWLDWTIVGYREFGRLHQPQYGERAIVSKGSGNFVGLVGMVPCLDRFMQLPSEGRRADAPNTPEVGLFWALSPHAQQRGYATEAAKRFIEYLFDRYRLKRVVATTERDNARSIGVMKRLGMTVQENPFVDPEHLQVVGMLARPE